MIETGKVYQVRVGSHHISCVVLKALGEERFSVKTMGSGKTFATYAGAIRGDGMTVEEYKAKTEGEKKPDAPADADADKPAKKMRTVPMPKQKKAKAAAGGKDKSDQGGKKISGLDAAAAVLAEAKAPMNTTDMVKRMLDSGLWQTGGKTPAATIYAAIIREIRDKGDASRFRKTDRGLFELTAK